jgi:hypothetical protein
MRILLIIRQLGRLDASAGRIRRRAAIGTPIRGRSMRILLIIHRLGDREMGGGVSSSGDCGSDVEGRYKTFDTPPVRR